MRLRRLLMATWPWRWSRAALALARRVRVHPSAVLIGTSKQVVLGRGAKVGARCRLAAGAAGRIEIGAGAWLSADVEIETDTHVRIGERTTIQRRCTVNGNTRVGAQCIFAPNVFVSSGTHPFRSMPHLPIREQERLIAAAPAGLAAHDRPVWIQDDCWLGANSVVCPGVTIGKGSVVGANAVVTRDVPPYSVVGGSPARVIGRRLDWTPPESLRAEHAEDLPYVLSGRNVPGTGGAACIQVAPGEPLRVALAASRLAGVVVEYHADRTLDIEVAGTVQQVSAGRGRLTLSREQLEVAGDVAYCALAVRSDNAADTLRITRLDVLPRD